MPIYKKPEERAGETVTIRLTLNERRMLDHLSAVDEMTLTDFIRSLIAKRATELNITEPPPPKVRRRPGRPKKKRPESIPSIPLTKYSTSDDDDFPLQQDVPVEQPSTAASVASTASLTSYLPLLPNLSPVSKVPEAAPHLSVFASAYSVIPETQSPSVFGDLVVRFRNSFVHRADGTKRELEDAIAFLCRETLGGRPIIPLDLPLSELTSERLNDVRLSIRDTDARLAKKNLYLTYLRMMLHFAVKEPDIDLRINPSRELPPLSIAESNESRRFFTGFSD
jgi:hypothetical protein